MDANEAKAALGAAQDARAKLAAASACPAWRHPVSGLIMAALVTQAALPVALGMPVLAFAMAGVVIVAQSDRKRTGLFINGWRRGPTLPISIALFVGLIGLMLWEVALRRAHAPAWQAVAVGAAAFALTTGASLAWQRAYVASLRRELAA